MQKQATDKSLSIMVDTAHLPSPKPILTLASHLAQDVGLGEG